MVMMCQNSTLGEPEAEMKNSLNYQPTQWPWTNQQVIFFLSPWQLFLLPVGIELMQTPIIYLHWNFIWYEFMLNFILHTMFDYTNYSFEQDCRNIGCWLNYLNRQIVIKYFKKHCLHINMILTMVDHFLVFTEGLSDF